MLALDAPQVPRRKWHPQALLGRRGAMPRLSAIQRSAMLLLTIALHVAVVGLVLLNRPDAPPEVTLTPPPPVHWPIPVHLPGSPPPGGGGGSSHGPNILKTILTPIALLEQRAEAAPVEETPRVDEAPPAMDQGGFVGESSRGPGSDGTGEDGTGTGHRDGAGPGDGDGPPGPPGSPGDGIPEGPISLRSDLVPPVLVDRVDPEMPLSLRHPPRNANVKLRCVIERDGSVRVLDVLKDSAGVQRAAVKAVEQWRYEPATTKDGRPVAVFLTVDVKFSTR